MVNQIQKDITEIKVAVGRIEEKLGYISGSTNSNISDIKQLQKFNYKLLGAAGVVFFIIELVIKLF